MLGPIFPLLHLHQRMWYAHLVAWVTTVLEGLQQGLIALQGSIVPLPQLNYRVHQGHTAH